MRDTAVEVVKELVDRYREVIGPPADGIARKSSSVMYEDGEIVAVNGVSGIEQLIRDYESVIGAVAIRIAKTVVSDYDVEIQVERE